MSSLSQKSRSDSTTVAEKRNSRKAAVILVLVLGVIFLVIWFGREYLAVESVISETHVQVNGQNRMLKFSEKTSDHRIKNADGFYESGIAHFAYFLELTDPVSNVSLDKIRFKSPVNEIQNVPELIAFPNGTVWIISTADADFRDTKGFIFKFTISADKILETPFTLDEKYGIRDITEHKVILSEKGSFYAPYHPVFGGIYLDLETCEVVDDRGSSEGGSLE